jgi:hypothetical protein
MKLFTIFSIASIVLCSSFTNESMKEALHENGEVYGWREEE